MIQHHQVDLISSRPYHSQVVECVVKYIFAASSIVYGQGSRYEMILQRTASRTELPIFGYESEFLWNHKLQNVRDWNPDHRMCP